MRPCEQHDDGPVWEQGTRLQRAIKITPHAQPRPFPNGPYGGMGFTYVIRGTNVGV